MKFLILVSVICLIGSLSAVQFQINENISEEQRKAFSQIDFPIFRSRAENGHWCCTNDQPAVLEQRTKIATIQYVVMTKEITGYTKCGFMNLMTCTLHTSKTKHQIGYYVQTYEVPNEQACLDHHVKCCKGFIEVAGNCFDLQELGGHYDLILSLVQAGLISTVNTAVGK